MILAHQFGSCEQNNAIVVIYLIQHFKSNSESF